MQIVTNKESRRLWETTVATYFKR